MKRRKNSAKIMRNVANVFRFYAIIVIKHGFSVHYSPDTLGGVENHDLQPRFSTPPTGPGKC